MIDNSEVNMKVLYKSVEDYRLAADKAYMAKDTLAYIQALGQWRYFYSLCGKLEAIQAIQATLN